eukprot:Hpha_TRINITY_DN16259_c2_g11::TRINITY_DN16259_c2_g11_i1::g.16453::m.16453
MGCVQNSRVYTRSEVEEAVNAQGPDQDRIQQMSPNVAVITGSGWIFNPKPPIDPALGRKLEHHCGKLTYAGAMERVASAFVDSHVGLTCSYSPEEIPIRRERARKAIDAALEELNKETQLTWTTEAGRAETQLVGVKGTRRGHSTTTVHTIETRIYVLFPEEDQKIDPSKDEISIEKIQ